MPKDLFSALWKSNSPNRINILIWIMLNSSLNTAYLLQSLDFRTRAMPEDKICQVHTQVYLHVSHNSTSIIDCPPLSKLSHSFCSKTIPMGCNKYILDSLETEETIIKNLEKSQYPQACPRGVFLPHRTCVQGMLGHVGPTF